MAETGPKSADNKIAGQGDASTVPPAGTDALEHLDDIPAELSEEELSAFLENEDPEFTKSVSEIGKDKSLFVKDIVLSSEEQEFAEEVLLWEKAHGIKARLFKLLPGLPRVSLRLKKLKFKLFLATRALWVELKNFGYFLATTGRANFVGQIKSVLHAIQESIRIRREFFEKLSKPRKTLAVLVLLSTILTGLFIYRSLTKGIIPHADELFIPSMESLASQVYEYDPDTESEPFYDNLRVTQNLLLLPKVVVNLKPSSGHKLPMAAFEFFIEGLIPEVIVEVKDREAAVKDTMQRAIEEFTFDSLESGEGKRELCERLKKEINLLLTTGSIKKVLIKTVVLKP